MFTFGDVQKAFDKKYPNPPSTLTDEELKELDNRPLNFPPELNELLVQFINRNSK